MNTFMIVYNILFLMIVVVSKYIRKETSFSVVQWVGIYFIMFITNIMFVMYCNCRRRYSKVLSVPKPQLKEEPFKMEVQKLESGAYEKAKDEEVPKKYTDPLFLNAGHTNNRNFGLTVPTKDMDAFKNALFAEFPERNCKYLSSLKTTKGFNKECIPKEIKKKLYEI